MESNDYPLNVNNNELNPNTLNPNILNAQNNSQPIQNNGISVEINNNNYDKNTKTNGEDNINNNAAFNNYINNGIEKPKYNQDNIVVDVNNMNNIEKGNANEQISNLNYSFSFFDGYELKSKFLMKVYGIVFFEFVLIFALVLIFQIKKIKDYLYEKPIFAIIVSSISLVIFIIIVIIFECNPKLLNVVPANYILLFVVAICLGFTCALIASCYSFQVVVGAITCVIAISIGCFIIVLIDKNREIKAWHFIIGSLILLCIQFGVMALIFRSYYMLFLYDVIGALLYTIYIAFDAIIIRDGLSIDDYIFAAFILTIDLIRLFIIILKILGSINGNK